MLKLEKARLRHMYTILESIRQAREYLERMGVAQWQEGYPDAVCIEEDIRAGCGYFINLDEKIAGYICVDFRGETAYENIEGQWLSQGAYGVIHRLAIDDAFRGMGLTGQVFALVEDLCRKRQVYSIKVDTHEENRTMRHVLEKNGYQNCGIVHYEDGVRVVYEKLLEQQGT